MLKMKMKESQGSDCSSFQRKRNPIARDCKRKRQKRSSGSVKNKSAQESSADNVSLNGFIN